MDGTAFAALVTAVAAAGVAAWGAFRKEKRLDVQAVAEADRVRAEADRVEAENARTRTQTERDDEATAIEQYSQLINRMQAQFDKERKRWEADRERYGAELTASFRERSECREANARLETELGHLRRQTADQERRLRELEGRADG